MTNQLKNINRQLSRLRSLMPPGENLREFVSHILDERITSVAQESPMALDRRMGIVRLPQERLLASARMAAEMIDAPDDLAAKPEGIVDLGTIGWLLRPALPLRDGIFDSIESGVWKHLTSDAVEQHSPSVCRLDVSISGSDPMQIGTGFVAGKDADGKSLIITNAHVVEEVIRLGWPSNNQISFGCDFSRFSVDSGGELYLLETEYKLHSSYDIALLFLSSESAHLKNSAEPLSMSASSPENITGLKIGIVGHPAFDSRRDSFPQLFGFGDEFGIKRFSPGFIQTLDNRTWQGNNVQMFLHDATTLSGSSGSCIFDLDTMNVVGIHFGGWPLPKQKIEIAQGDALAELFESNGAVPTWKLSQDSFFEEVNFK